VELVYLIATGILAGFVGSLFGLGGGIVIVPVLTLLFKLPVIEAVGTSLVSIAAVSSVAAIDFLKSGRVDLELGLIIALAASIGALAGGILAEFIPSKSIYLAFSFILIGAALNMTRPKRIMLIDKQYGSASNKILGYGLSLLAGGVSGILGVGGGIIQVPVMRTIMRVPMKIATATSSYMIGILVAPAALLYLLRGDVDLFKAAAIIIGTYAGSMMGAAFSYRITSLLLRLLFVGIMIFTAYKMLLKGLL
jgi:uncharacterized membrane protein YfcA